MNKFDGWLNSDKCTLKDYPQWNHRELCMCETAWKAALNWVLENYDGKTDMLELALRIRKEMDYE